MRSNIKNNCNECNKCLTRYIHKVLGDCSWNNYLCLRVEEMLLRKKWLLAATLAKKKKNALTSFIMKSKAY